MSIWVSKFNIGTDHPTGSPYEVDWPGDALPRDDEAWVDVASVMAQAGPGWVRLSLGNGYGDGEVVLDPTQVAALRDALTVVLEDEGI